MAKISFMSVFWSVLIVLALGGLFWGGSVVVKNIQQQTLLAQQIADRQEQQEAGVAAPPSQQGKIASYKFFAYDRENNNRNTVVLTPIYVWEKDTTTFASDGSAGTSTSTRKAVSLTRGKTYMAEAFNNTVCAAGASACYYGTRIEFVATDEKDDIDLDVHKICTTGEMLAFDSSLVTRNNITVGASQTETFDKLRFRINTTDCMYRFAGVYFDTGVGSNITNIAPGGTSDLEGMAGVSAPTVSKTNIQIERVKELDDYVWELSTPINMQESDKINIHTIEVTADGEGCGTGQGEWVKAYAFDKTSARSQKAGLGIINVIETDAQTPADIGANDIQSDNCNGCTVGQLFECT